MSKAAEAIRGEIPFPQAGEGVTLRFTNPVILTLQGKLGDDFIASAFERISKFDTRFVAECVNAAIHKDGKPGVMRFTDLDHVPIDEIGLVVLDGIYLAVFGRRFEEQLEYARIMRARRDGDEGPPESPAT